MHNAYRLITRRGWIYACLSIATLFAGTAHAGPWNQVDGCADEIGYDVGPKGDYTVVLRLRDAAGVPHLIAFGDKNIQYVTSGTPLVTTAATLYWSRILDTLERGIAAKRQVRVLYDSTGHVFGISIIYYAMCK